MIRWLRRLILCLSLLVLSCTRNKAGPSIRFPDGHHETLSESETLRLDWSWHSLDWQKTDNRLLDNIMEGLLRYDFSGESVRLAPGLASQWFSSDHGRKWTFEIRQNVIWTDGVPFRPEQVVDGWRRVLDPNTASEVAYFLFPIKNARAFNAGQLPFEKVGVRVRDRRIEVELEKPTVFFPYLMTNAATYPIRRDLIEKFGDDWAKPQNLVTLGAYRIVTEEPDVALSLERSDSYYDPQSFSNDAPKNVFTYLTGDSASLGLFEAGKLDLLPYVSSLELRAIDDHLEPRRQRMFSVTYLAFGTKTPPLDSAPMRRAVALALDRNEILKTRAGFPRLLTGWVPEGMLGYGVHAGLEHSLEDARRILSRAGFPDGKGLPTIELAIYQREDQPTAENIQFQLKKNLGIAVEVRFEEWKSLRTRFKTNPPAMLLHGWDVDYPDPHNMFDLLTSRAGNNRTNFANRAYDDLVDRAAGTFDTKVRLDLYRRAGEIALRTEVPVYPLFSIDRAFLMSPHVSRYEGNPLGKIIFKNIGLKRR